jgi:hypothetical protein
MKVTRGTIEMRVVYTTPEAMIEIRSLVNLPRQTLQKSINLAMAIPIGPLSEADELISRSFIVFQAPYHTGIVTGRAI